MSDPQRQAETRREYIVAALRQAGCMYPEGAEAYLREHEVAVESAARAGERRLSVDGIRRAARANDWSPWAADYISSDVDFDGDAVEVEHAARDAAVRAAGRAAGLRDAEQAILRHSGPNSWPPALPRGEGDGFWWDTRDRDAAAGIVAALAAAGQAPAPDGTCAVQDCGPCSFQRAIPRGGYRCPHFTAPQPDACLCRNRAGLVVRACPSCGTYVTGPCPECAPAPQPETCGRVESTMFGLVGPCIRVPHGENEAHRAANGTTWWKRPVPQPCCNLHKPVGCCDPVDCGPCREECPTCPTLIRNRCTCGDAGDAFVPAGHYADCPQAPAPQPECAECGDTGACNGGLCAHPAAPQPETAPDAEVCVECGGGPVVYHNYREQPFCWPCADGRGPRATAPSQDADVEIRQPHEVGVAHGCPEECPLHNPGGSDVAAGALSWTAATPDAEPGTPDDTRHPVLGAFVVCWGNGPDMPHCDRGEWESKARERGWAHDTVNGRWLCPSCVAAAEQRAADLADISDEPDAEPGTPDDTERERFQDEAEIAAMHEHGDHSACGVACEVSLPSEYLRNFMLRRAYPGAGGALDELLRRERAVRDDALTTAQREAASDREAARLALEQRQEMAAERYALQQRAEAAERQVVAVREYAQTSDDDGIRTREIVLGIVGDQPPPAGLAPRDATAVDGGQR